MTGSMSRLEQRVLQALRIFLGLGLITMVLLNVANAAGRYGGLPTLTGADELLVFGMIWIVMIGGILTTRDRSHLAIDLLPPMFGGRGQLILQIGTSVVTAVVSAFIAWHSWTFIDRIGAVGQKSMGLGIPMTVPHFAVLTGFAGTAMVSILLVAGDARAALQGGNE